MSKYLLLLLLVICPCVFAQEYSLSPEGIINNLATDFIGSISKSAAPIKSAANRLFWTLMPISLVLIGIRCIFKDGNIQLFFYELVKLLIISGLYLFMLDNGVAIGHSIVDSMTSVVTDSNTGPSELVDMTFNMASSLYSKVVDNYFNPVTKAILILQVLAFEIIMFLLIIRYTIVFICAHVLCICGIFVLGFGAFSYTRYIAFNYLKYIVSVSLELMTMIIICNAGSYVLSDLEGQCEKLVEQGSSITATELSVIIFTALFMYALGRSLPQLVGQLVSGTPLKTSNSGLSFMNFRPAPGASRAGK
ncbi:MAG: P-type conjugative transfer protein TrbL [Succinivibrio sp.]